MFNFKRYGNDSDVVRPIYCKDMHRHVLYEQSGICRSHPSNQHPLPVHYGRVWDVETRSLLRATRLDLPALSCAVAPDSTQLAVGLKYGTVVILNAK